MVSGGKEVLRWKKRLLAGYAHIAHKTVVVVGGRKKFREGEPNEKAQSYKPTIFVVILMGK